MSRCFTGRLRDLLAAKKYTPDRYKYLARYCGVDESTFFDWVAGRRFPNGEHEAELAEALGVDARWLAVGSAGREIDDAEYGLDGERREHDTFRGRVALALRRRGWDELPAREIAQRMGVHEMTLRNWLRRVTAPVRSRPLASAAAALGVSVAWLAGKEDRAAAEHCRCTGPPGSVKSTGVF